MNTKTFSEYLKSLEATTSRNKMTEILADLLTKASAEEIDKICYFIGGRIAPLYSSLEFSLAEKMMIKIIAYSTQKSEKEITNKFKKTGDLGDITVCLSSSSKKEGGLPINILFEKLILIAKQEGKGSQERKIKLFGNLINEVNSDFRKFLVRLPLGKLRLGFSDLTTLDALSWMVTKNKSLRPVLEEAYNVAADIGLVAKVLKKEGIAGIRKIKPIVGIPIKPALTERISNLSKIIEKLENPAAEPKYDGFRVQIHLDKKKQEKNSESGGFFEKKIGLVKIFSRKLEDITKMFPEILIAVNNLTADSLILDGEAIGLDPKTGHFLPFQETAQRKRKYDIEKKAKEIPLKVFVFDILFLNGKNLIKKPFLERRKILEKIFKNKTQETILLTPQIITNSEEKLEKFFNQSVTNNLEGIVCKKLTSPYRAGKRDFAWVKYKKAMKEQLIDTVDCLVMGYYLGKGKRASFGIGALLVGIFDPQREKFLTIAKIGTGLSDIQWQEIQKEAKKIRVKIAPKEYLVPKNLIPDIWCQPKIIVEIAADEITRSPVHTSGYALRFPRMKKARAKKPEDITTIKEIKNLYNNQKK